MTGEKALYVNQGFTRRIVGYKVEESEYLLGFLFDHIAKGSDFQVRAKYTPGTVVVWVSAISTSILYIADALGPRTIGLRATPLLMISGVSRGVTQSG